MNISASEMGEITSAWSNRLTSWQATVTSDETEYDFDDTDYSKYKAEGRETAKEKTGGHENDSGEKAESYGTSTVALGAAVCTTIMAAQMGAFKTGKMSLTATPMAWVAAGLQAAAATLYYCLKPNKDGTEACNALQEDMAGAQTDLAGRQQEMSDYSGEIMDLSDQTMEINEATNEQIAEQKTLYDQYMQTILALQAKVDAGEELTDSEKELYNEVVGILQETGVTIEDLAATSGEEVTEIYDEMGEYQDGYDEVAESMGQVEGLTDYAADFDEETKLQTEILGTILGLNAGVCGALTARLLADGNPFTKVASAVMAVVAAGAGVANGFAAAEQFDYAEQISNEIDAREMTQDINSETMGMYDEEIDAFDGFMQGVEDLELEIPEEFGSEDEGVEAPTVEVALPTGGTGGSTEDTDPKPKPKDEEK